MRVFAPLALASALFAALFVTAAAATPETPTTPTTPTAKLSITKVDPPQKDGRLSREVVPTREEIALRIDPREERYSGSVVIDVDVKAPRTVLYLHARGLTVTAATVTPATAGGTAAGTAQPARFAVLDAAEGTASLTLNRAVVGKATVRLTFHAPFHTDLNGLYRVQHEGNWYAFSQFEAIAARDAFPCFDEPAWKIPFTVSVTHPTSMKAIGNTTSIGSQANPDGTTLTKFATTKPLPTYLLAFVVGDVDVVDGGVLAPAADRAAPLPVRAIAPKGQGPRLSHSLDNAKRLLAAEEEMFGIGYPFDKLDIVAVPDFSAGAMENAGLITFRDSRLYLDDNSDIAAQKAGFETVAHELAHQWFGNLVTMAWWDDLWLNEAFATWFAARAGQKVQPDFDGAFDLRLSANWVMDEDSLVATRRIRNPITSRGDIDNAFDGITYSKGAAVIAMFEEYIDRQKGAGTFMRGVQAYLRDHRFGSGSTAEFLRAISGAAGIDVDAAFSTFLDQPGVPLVQASCAVNAKVKGPPTVSLSTTRFLPVGSQAEAKGQSTQQWDIPFCVNLLDKKNTTLCTIVAGGTGHLELPGATCPAAFHPNADGGGYYRFALPAPEMAALAKKTASMTAGERLSFASALQSGVSRGTLEFGAALKAAEPLMNDPESSVAQTPLSLLHFARDDVFGVDVAHRRAVNAKLAKLVQPALNKLGLVARAKDTPRDRERRALLFAVAVDADGAPKKIAIAAGKELFEKGSTTLVAADLYDSALVAAVRAGVSAAQWDAWLARAKKEPSPVLRDQLLGALAATLDPALSEKALRLVFDPDLRTNEVMSGLSAQGHDPRTVDAAFAFLQKNYDAVAARLPEDWRAGLSGTFAYCDATKVAALEAFFQPKVATTSGLDVALAQNLESMRLCVAKKAAHEAAVRKLFP